jgi:benzoylformate decarboxylase
MSAFAEELAKHLPKDVIIFDEALTNSAALTRYIVPSVPGRFYQTPGGTLGVGLPGAIGVKLARPEHTVVGFSGDGGAAFTLPALWTAAHYRIAAKFVVCNNRSYRILTWWSTGATSRCSRATSPPPSTSVIPTSTTSRWRREWACRGRA